MATLISKQNGGFSAAATWALADTTSLQLTGTSTTSLTTSYVGGTAFTPGAIVVDGIGVHIHTRAQTASGTFSVRLSAGGVLVAGTEVTVNVADVIYDSSGWFFFKFAAPVTLVAATAYKVDAKVTVTSGVTLKRDGTTANYARFLRTTTVSPAAPAAADVTIITGEWTAAGTSTVWTVTLDTTSAAVSYGNLWVGSKGVANCATDAATAYYLKLAGNLTVGGGGEFKLASSGTRLPASSTWTIHFASASAGQYGFICEGGLVGIYGALQPVPSTLLTANAASGAVSLTSSVATGWKSGDLIGIAMCGTGSTASETKALSADAVGTTLSIAALATAHSGTDPQQAELINLTRNVKIRGESVTFYSYLNMQAFAAAITLREIEFQYWGGSTSQKSGLYLASTSTTVAVDIQFCSIRDGARYGFEVAGAVGTSSSITFSSNVMYSILGGVIANAVSTGAIVTLYKITDNVFMLPTGVISYCFNLSTYGTAVDVSRNRMCGDGLSGGGISIEGNVNQQGVLDGNVVHNFGTNVNLIDVGKLTLSAWLSYDCTGAADIRFNNCRNLTMNNLRVFGTADTLIEFDIFPSYKITFEGGQCRKLTSTGATRAINMGVDCVDIVFNGMDFNGAVSFTYLMDAPGASAAQYRVEFHSCPCGTADPTAFGYYVMADGSFYKFSNYNNVAGDFRTYKAQGYLKRSTTLFDTTPASEEVHAVSLSNWGLMRSTRIAVWVNAGDAVTVSVRVRKSAGYNTSGYAVEPKLYLERNPEQGIAADTLLGTMTVAHSTWQTLTGTTPAATQAGVFYFYVASGSHNGDADYVTIDTFTAA